MTIKEKIKELVALQIQLKNQRKTTYLLGERTMSAYDAANHHRRNRELLREHYHAYAKLRGKEVSEARVNALIELYTIKPVEQ